MSEVLYDFDFEDDFTLRSMGNINVDALDSLMRALMSDFMKNKTQIKELIEQVAPDFNEQVARVMLYADATCGDMSARNNRFSLFVMMYEGCELLRNDDSMAYNFFLDAYVNSSNIHKQLKETPFDIRGFLSKMQSSVSIYTKLDDKSEPWFDGLPNSFTVYRGLSKAERDSGQLGVSWAVDAVYAEKYLHLQDNEVTGDVGYVAAMTIEKSDVIAVCYEYHPEICYEIITLKNDGVRFTEVRLQ